MRQLLRAGGVRTESLRRAYFAQAGDVAVRYGIVFDQLIEHVRAAEVLNRRVGSYTIRYVEDLIHAIACLDEIELAWRDLGEQHERALVRSCQDRMDESDEIVLVRRFFAQLRRGGEPSGGKAAPTLHPYNGTSSLRRWMRGRLLDWLDELDGKPAPTLSLVGSTASATNHVAASLPAVSGHEPREVHRRACGDYCVWPRR